VNAIPCPSCAAPMEHRDFERKVSGDVGIDVCFPCHAMWFDQFESAALAPGAIVQLFREINEHRNDPQKPLAEKCRCPRCSGTLAFTQDMQRNNRLTYYRCAAGHGRFTTFYMFLREKNFVRSLSEKEAVTLRAQVKQVRCSSCGAPIDLEHNMTCPYCHAPVSILDPEQVRRTLLELDGMQRKAADLDANRLAQIVLAGGGRVTALAPAGGRGATPRPDPPATVHALEAGGSALLVGAADLIGAAIEHYFDD